MPRSNQCRFHQSSLAAQTLPELPSSIASSAHRPCPTQHRNAPPLRAFPQGSSRIAHCSTFESCPRPTSRCRYLLVCPEYRCQAPLGGATIKLADSGEIEPDTL